MGVVEASTRLGVQWEVWRGVVERAYNDHSRLRTRQIVPAGLHDERINLEGLSERK